MRSTSSVMYGSASGSSRLDQRDELRRGRDDLLVEHLRLLEEGHDVVAEVRAQRRAPALVLLEQPGVALPARLGELERLAVVVGDVEPLELVAEQDLLELGVLLDVALALALGELVQRRLGDVDVARLDQLAASRGTAA